MLSVQGDVRVKGDEGKAQALMEKAESYMVKGRPGDALDTLKSLVTRYRKVPMASEAQFKIAVLYESNHEWVRAFDAYQDFFEWFPASNRFNEGIEGQLRLAKRMQREIEKERRKGERSKNRRNLPGGETPSDMFRLILENGKHTELSPLIRYQLGAAYEREDRTLSAKKMFGTIPSHYPNHHLADDAAFQIGYIDYKGTLKGELRRSFNAEMALRDFLLNYPKSEKSPEAYYCLREMRKAEAANKIKLAAYYEDKGKAKSAILYLESVLGDYGEFVNDREALKERINELRKNIPEDKDSFELP